MFADDTNIYFESDNLKNLEKIMNKELKRLYEWLCLNRLSLNITKTNCVMFQARNKPKIPVTICINGQAVEEVAYVKYLGVLIDSQLTFKNHIDELNKKISRAIGILNKLRPFVTTKILTNVYYAIVYPFLLYGIIIWGNASNNLITSIHKLQKKFVRMATNNDDHPVVPGPLVHTLPIFFKLNLLTIFDIYKLQVGKFVYESINGIGPSQNIVKFKKVSGVHNYNTRYATSGGLFVGNVRTTQYGKGSLKIEGKNIWDTIPNKVKGCLTKKSFNVRFKKELLKAYATVG